MAGGDEEDYFDGDDDEFDEDLLNAIDAVEKTYLSQAPHKAVLAAQAPSPKNRSPPSSTEFPPEKRPRTANWSTKAPNAPPKSVAGRAASSSFARMPIQQTTEYDDLPEISIGGDGTYNLTQFAPLGGNPQPHPAHNPPTAFRPSLKPPQSTKSYGQHGTPPNPPLKAQSSGHQSSTVQNGATKITNPQIRHSPLQRKSSSPHPLSQPHASQQPKKPPWTTPPNPSRQLPPASSRLTSNDPPNNVGVPFSSRALNGVATASEVEHLRAQLELLQTESTALRQSLKEAETSKLIKEGEASTVRRLMEKQTKTHAEAIARLKAEKQESSSAVNSLEVHLRSEIDALQTRLKFQQHELETSSRRSGWAGASARTGVQPRASQQVRPPIQTPRRSGGWSTPRGSVNRESSYRLGSQARPSSPLKPGSARPVKPDNPPEPQFASFHNSFANSTSPVKKRGAAAKAIKNGSRPNTPTKTASPLKAAGLPQVNGAMSSPARFFADDDHQMLDENAGGASPRTVDGDLFDEGELPIRNSEPESWAIDWRQELHGVLFSHALADFTQRPFIEPELTLQMLVSLRFPEDTDSTVVKQFHRCCALTLGAFAAHGPEFGWQALVRDIAQGLVGCAALLIRLQLFPPLTPLLDLIASIITDIPEFSIEFLAVGPNDLTWNKEDREMEDVDREESLLVSGICDVIRTRFVPPPEHIREGAASKDTARPLNAVHALPPEWEWDKAKNGLGKTILRAMEALCWVCPEGSLPKLETFCNAPSCILNLIDFGQPGWAVERATRLLILLSSHRQLFSSLMSSVDDHPNEPEWRKIPLVDRVCTFLVTPHRWAADSENLAITKHGATFLFSVTEAHEDAIPMLVDSQSVIPSLIMCLWRLSLIIWEDDNLLADCTDETQLEFINTIHPVLHLLWYLVNPTNTEAVNLRMKIYQATARDPQTYNGLHHLFMAGIGRLSYAPPPDWMCAAARTCLDTMNQLARELLDSVVEGPECDAIWEAYEDEEKGSGGNAERNDNSFLAAGVSAEEEEMAMAVDMELGEDESGL